MLFCPAPPHPPSSHWLLMGNTTSAHPSAWCPSPGWLNVFRLMFSPADPMSSPSPSPHSPVAASSSLPHLFAFVPVLPSAWTVQLLSWNLSKSFHTWKAQHKSHLSAAFPSHASQNFSSLSQLWGWHSFLYLSAFTWPQITAGCLRASLPHRPLVLKNKNWIVFLFAYQP